MMEIVARNPVTAEMVANLIQKIDKEMRMLDESAKTLRNSENT